MRRWLERAARHKMAAAYALALVLWALCALGCAGWDAAGFATGRLRTVQLPLAELPAQDIALDENGNWVTTGGDPQWQLAPDQPVRSVRLSTTAPAAGFEGYYGRAGQAPSLRRRVWAQETAAGEVLLVFPLGTGQVRLDPAGGAGVAVAAGAGAVLTVNAPLPLWQYFVPRGAAGPALALAPALAAAVWDLGALWAGLLKKRRTADTENKE